MSLNKHVTAVNAKCVFQLRQLRRIRRSLDDDSAATPVRTFAAVVSWSKKTTDKLQRVLNAAARIVSNTRKYDRRLIGAGRRRPGSVQGLCPGVQVSAKHGA